MESFKEFVDGSEHSETVEEGALRILGAAALFSRMVSLSRKINRSKSVEEKIDLISDQNVTLAGLALSVGKFLEKSNR